MAIQQELVERERWIMDGDLGPYDVVDLRLRAADTVIFLDFSLARCAWRAIRRSPERADFWPWPVAYRRRSLPSCLKRQPRTPARRMSISFVALARSSDSSNGSGPIGEIPASRWRLGRRWNNSRASRGLLALVRIEMRDPDRTRPMNRLALWILASALPSTALSAQARSYPLESASGLRLHNVSAQAVTFQEKKGVRVTISEEAVRRVQSMAPDSQALFEQLAVIEGLDFANGVIEAEIAGEPGPGAAGGARGFVGIAFRLQPDMRTYDAFYLRPTNGRAEDQERRNHAAQYIAHPDWPWFRLRRETPSRYESYVDLMPGVWTKVKIEVRGDRARLYVHGQEQPTLVVNDVESGASAKGAVALWIGPGTIAHFRNLTVTPLSAKNPK